MSLLRMSVMAGLLLECMSLQAQAEPAVREYGVSLGAAAGRNWAGPHANDYLDLRGTLLFLNEHFHFGPQISYSRSYTDLWQTTSGSVGAIGKWTYENLQTTAHTPFILLGVDRGHSKSSFDTSDTTSVFTAVGYENFLTSSVSLEQGVTWRKLWSPGTTEDLTYASAYINLNVYL